MKIVFLSYLEGFGGAEKQNIMLANAIVEKGHSVTLVSVSADNVCYPLDERVRYIYLPDKNHSPLKLVFRYKDIKKVLKEIRPDLTVSFWFQSAYLTALMRKSITGKVVYSERSDPGDKQYSGFLGVVRSLTLPRIDGFVFQSKGAQNYFNKKVQARSTVIANPMFVDKALFPKVLNRRKVIVTVGRLHTQKNHRLLIDAFAMIEKRFPEYQLEIYGDGELKEETQQYILNSNLAEKVHLMGTSKDIFRKMYDASLFVLSSDFEGLPNTLIEAMALGIPCISTDCKPGGAREIITQKKDGIIVPRNNAEELAKAITDCLNNKSMAEMFGERAAENMKRFKPEIIYGKWDIYFSNL